MLLADLVFLLLYITYLFITQLAYMFTDQTKKFEYSGYATKYRNFVFRVGEREKNGQLNLKDLLLEILDEIEDQQELHAVVPDDLKPSKIDKDELLDIE